MMEKKFQRVAANEENPKWNQIIKRERELYTRPNDLRNAFERDYDRIIHSTVFRRLKNKTQVFYAPKNDSICTRIEHVNYVASLAETISRNLGLNEDLVRAIATAHDVGHSPFGHKGGTVLSAISERELNGQTFWHERNGLYIVDNIQLLENTQGKRRNLDLTYGVRDGIISHCGEIDENAIKPREEAIDLYTYTKPNEYAPYTWEGCVVKICDKISYVGRDIEDSRIIGLMEGHEEELEEISMKYANEKLNNSYIINTLITDLCENSSVEEGLKFSKKSLDMMNEIKAFNARIIYASDLLKPSNKFFEVCLNQIYDTLKSGYDGIKTFEKLDSMKKYYPNLINSFSAWLKTYVDIGDRGNLDNKILFDLNNESDYYFAVIEYISGMTDNFAIETYDEIIQY